MREADGVEEDGTIEGEVNIPLWQLVRKSRQGAMDGLKGAEIVTCCNGGHRGNVGADELARKGFKATATDGGYSARKEEKAKKNK